ncbi:hypothetical protein [Sphingomonas flavalba]|uniref:hypothetical protein n=1 Tax=Sphingomonas flavalba TaxID=2559804 RepID=UPI00109DDF8D|nr:hypothetical protein [Sphingomonas flavalba]
MQRRALRIHIAEPLHFEAANGTADLVGWTTTPEDEGEWIVNFERSWTIGDESFDRLLVSPRYVGEQLAGVGERILGLAVNIRRWRGSEWHFDMIGTLAAQREQA